MSEVGQSGALGAVGPTAPAESNSGVTRSTGPSIASRKAALAKAGMSLTDKTNATQRTVTQNSLEIGVAKMPAGRMSDAVDACARLAQQPDISREAKAVYQHLGDILRTATERIGNNFSADHIATELSSVFSIRSELFALSGTGEVGMYDSKKDGEFGYGKSSSDHGYPAPIAPESCVQCCTTNKVLNYGKTVPKNAELPNPPNVACVKSWCPAESQINLAKVDLDSYDDMGDEEYRYHLKSDGELGQEMVVLGPAKEKMQSYIRQVQDEFDQFSGNVHIHKLAPGTVLVRVFGQGQKAVGSCWCNVTDSKSSVTCAEDLYTKLAVKAEWNGDGNLAVFIVPDDIEVYVAEGKIASQIGKYTTRSKEETKYETSTDHVFIYEGGGTQLNILTPTGDAHFGGSEKITECCMFCLRDDGIMEFKTTDNPRN